MRLLVNTASTYKGGGVQVAISFLRECERLGEHEIGVILGPGLSRFVNEGDFSRRFSFFSLAYRPAQRVLSLQRTSKDLEQIESSFRPDVVFTTSGPSYWRPNAPHLMGFNSAAPSLPGLTVFYSSVKSDRETAVARQVHGDSSLYQGVCRCVGGADGRRQSTAAPVDLLRTGLHGAEHDQPGISGCATRR